MFFKGGDEATIGSATLDQGAFGQRYHWRLRLARDTGTATDLNFLPGDDIAYHGTKNHNDIGQDIALPQGAIADHQRTVQVAITLYLTFDQIIAVTAQIANELLIAVYGFGDTLKAVEDATIPHCQTFVFHDSKFIPQIGG